MKTRILLLVLLLILFAPLTEASVAKKVSTAGAEIAIDGAVFSISEAKELNSFDIDDVEAILLADGEIVFGEEILEFSEDSMVIALAHSSDRDLPIEILEPVNEKEPHQYD